MLRSLVLGVSAALVGSLLVLSAPTSPRAHRGPHVGEAAAKPVARKAAEAEPRVRRLVTHAAMRSAKRFAAQRSGTIGFAVLEEGGRVRGSNFDRVFYSASVTKAMLAVARLRQEAEPSAWEVAALEAMVASSDNDAADTVLGVVGVAGLDEVAQRAGMRAFDSGGYWANARITPADQVRLFARIDELVPASRRSLLRDLLSSVVDSQRWGIAAVAGRHRGARVYFKGGWREGMTHQVALVEWRGRRAALAVMTSGGPSMTYDIGTIEGIAGRLLSRPA